MAPFSKPPLYAPTDSPLFSVSCEIKWQRSRNRASLSSVWYHHSPRSPRLAPLEEVNLLAKCLYWKTPNVFKKYRHDKEGGGGLIYRIASETQYWLHIVIKSDRLTSGWWKFGETKSGRRRVNSKKKLFYFRFVFWKTFIIWD